MQLLFGSKSLSWSRHPDERIQDTVFSTDSLSANEIEAGAHLHKHGPFKTIGDLDRKDLSIYVTKTLYDAIAGIYFIANDYVMAGAEAQMFFPLDSVPLEPWPEELTPEEQAIPWLCVMLKILEPPEWMPGELARQGWGIDFSNFTPPKVQYPK